MNDFTKDELELIKWAIALLTIEEIEEYNCEKENFSEIMSKVKDMIANYCEHSKTYDCDLTVKVCSDCHSYGDDLL